MGLLSAIGGIAGSFLGGPVGGAIGSSLGGAIEGSQSASQAAGTQSAAAQAGIDEQRRQFDAVRALLAPYQQAGVGSLAQQQALLGLSGAAPQQAAIQGLQTSPQFQALMQQGENAMLQNAAATGGLRGGNLQAAMAQFRPQLLSQLIEQQYGRLGGLTSIGQNAAAGVGNAGMQTGTNIANLLGQQGRAQAGGQLASNALLSGGIQQAFGAVQGAGGFGQVFPSLFGGSAPQSMFDGPMDQQYMLDTQMMDF